MEDRQKRIIVILMVLTIIFTISGGTLAYWTWTSDESSKTLVTFTATKDFACAADGGGDITEQDAFIAPTSCTNAEHAIQREVTVTPTLNRNELTISMDLWLNVNSIGSGLSNSQNFRYALTTDSSSCENGVISSGTLNGKSAGSKVNLFEEKEYSSETPQKYYLYIWLDGAETSSSTMNQTFNLSLGGNCTDNLIKNPALMPNEYEFDYYSSIVSAISDVNNNTIGETADSNREDAVASVTYYEEKPYIVLLKDEILTQKAIVSSDVTINLNGNTLSSNSVVLEVASGNVTIDGEINGSTIKSFGSNALRTLQVVTGNVSLVGGSYIADLGTLSGQAATIMVRSNSLVNFDNVEVKALGETGGELRAINISSGGEIQMYNSKVTASFDSGVVDNAKSYGIVSFGDSGIYDSEIFSYSNIVVSNDSYVSNAIGIIQEQPGSMTLNNSYVFGIGEGISAIGVVNINGGIYEGYSLGAAYYSGENTTSYVKDATFRYVTIPNGYDGVSRYVGFYMGTNNNVTVYMDNCDVYSPGFPFAFENTANNLQLYISNSRTNLDYTLGFIDSAGDQGINTIYVGPGNNFTIHDILEPTIAIETNDIYR